MSWTARDYRFNRAQPYVEVLNHAGAQCRTARLRQRPEFRLVVLATADPVSGRAVTVYSPAVQFGTHVTVARPVASVIANGCVRWQVAPAEGTVKSTRTPAAGRSLESTTMARSAVPFDVTVIFALGGGRTAPKRMARMRRLSPSAK